MSHEGIGMAYMSSSELNSKFMHQHELNLHPMWLDVAFAMTSRQVLFANWLPILKSQTVTESVMSSLLSHVVLAGLWSEAAEA